jgi:ribonuclease HI
MDELISLHGIFLGHATNNIVEYNAVIELLTDAISFGICHLIVLLDSQLVVLQLNNVYSI